MRQDRVYQDIGFDQNGDLNISSLLAFAGPLSVAVITWYDQSGNGINLQKISFPITAIFSQLPTIVESGVLVTNDHGSVSLHFNGINGGAYQALYPNGNGHQILTGAVAEVTQLNEGFHSR